MAAIDHESDKRPPTSQCFQFSLTTLFLISLVLASSLAMFGSRGVVAFAIAGVLAVCLHYDYATARKVLTYLTAGSVVLFPLVAIIVLDTFGMLLALLMPALSSARETGEWGASIRTVAALAVWLISVALLVIRAMRSGKAAAQALADAKRP